MAVKQPKTALGVSSIEARFSLDVYDPAVIKKAAYRLLGECTIEISLDADQVTCQILFDEPVPDDRAERIRQRLIKEVLDQDLRQIVARETEPLRNAILGYAFSRTSLQQE